MMGKRGKEKGSSFERDVAAILAKAFYPDGSGVFRRVPLSGGWDKHVAPGDILAFKYREFGSEELVMDTRFPFVVECKNWKDIKQPFCGLYAADSELFSWMQQAVNAAVDSKKIPIVIFKLYRASIIAMLRGTDLCKLEELFGEYPKAAYGIVKRVPQLGVSAKLIMVLLAEFLVWIDLGIYHAIDSTKMIRSLVEKEE